MQGEGNMVADVEKDEDEGQSKIHKRELSESMEQKISAEYQAVGGSHDKPLQSNYSLNIIIAVAVLAILSSLVGN